MENTHESLGFLLHEATRAIRRAFEVRVSQHGLSSAQWRLLVHLAKKGESTQARLAELLEIEPISVSRLVDRMEAGGWVIRRADPADRRVRLVAPTERTQGLYGELRAQAEDVYGAALAGFAQGEAEAMTRSLTRMIGNLAAAQQAGEGKTGK